MAFLTMLLSVKLGLPYTLLVPAAESVLAFALTSNEVTETKKCLLPFRQRVFVRCHRSRYILQALILQGHLTAMTFVLLRAPK